MNQVTVRIALSCIPKECSNYPIFLIIDDTLQPKYVKHFEEYQLMFDHAYHNGSNYLKGHCFVGLVISVPVEVEGKMRYLSVPVGYRLRSKDENKLELAAKMVEQAIPITLPAIASSLARLCPKIFYLMTKNWKHSAQNCLKRTEAVFCLIAYMAFVWPSRLSFMNRIHQAKIKHIPTLEALAFAL